MRLIEKLDWRMLASRLNGAYKRMFNDDDKKLVIRDIVGFSGLGKYEPEVSYTHEQLAEIRGRQQMALHILRHLDIDANELISYQHDSQVQGAQMSNSQNQDGGATDYV